MSIQHTDLIDTRSAWRAAFEIWKFENCGLSFVCGARALAFCWVRQAKYRVRPAMGCKEVQGCCSCVRPGDRFHPISVRGQNCRWRTRHFLERRPKGTRCACKVNLYFLNNFDIVNLQQTYAFHLKIFITLKLKIFLSKLFQSGVQKGRRLSS